MWPVLGDFQEYYFCCLVMSVALLSEIKKKEEIEFMGHRSTCKYMAIIHPFFSIYKGTQH